MMSPTTGKRATFSVSSIIKTTTTSSMTTIPWNHLFSHIIFFIVVCSRDNICRENRHHQMRAPHQKVGRLAAAWLVISLHSSSVFICSGLQQPLVVSSSSSRTTRRSIISPLAVSQLEDTSEVVEGDLPYVISRGDGSTGGGGLPMPHQHSRGNTEDPTATERDDDDYRRPKVGAEMPKGRPSWFKVPAPSQGKNIDLNLLVTLCSTQWLTTSFYTRLLRDFLQLPTRDTRRWRILWKNLTYTLFVRKHSAQISESVGAEGLAPSCC